MTNTHYCRLASALILTLPFAATSQANEYSLDYEVTGGYEYNDNINMAAENEIAISGIKLSLPVTLATRNERLDASLRGEVATAKYDESNYDSNDQNLQGRAAYELERGNVAGHAGYQRNSTRTSEFLDTGVVGFTASRRESATVGGSGDYLFTDKNGIIAGADYSDVSYESPRLTDYDSIVGYAGWTNQWTERTRLRLQGTAFRYDNDAQIQATSDGLGIQVGFDSRFSEQLSMSLLAGWTNIDTEYSTNLPIAPQDDEDNDSVMVEGSLSYSRERYELSASIDIKPSAGGSGYVSNSGQLTLTYRYDVTERSSFKLGLVGGTRGALDDRIDDDRNYARADLRLDYRFSGALYLAGTYTFSYQDRDRSIGDAQSNAVYLSLVYHPEKSVWSR